MEPTQTTRTRKATVRRRLFNLLAAEGNLDLVEAALLIAAEEYEDLDVTREAARVRIISAEGARKVDLQENTFARLDGLRAFLCEDLGFRGNSRNYGDPRNSFLNEVLNRRLGIPITLSILYMEVAQAAGFEVRGVALPGHFVCRVTRNDRSLLVDPFHGCCIVTEEDCAQLVARTTGRPWLFRREVLEGTDERAVLERMLLNLKHVYLERKDYARALTAVQRLLIVTPGAPEEIRDRGLLKAHLGKPGAAIADLENYLEVSPGAPDAKSVRGRVVWLRRQTSELN